MNEKAKSEEILEVDVLVIGGGTAGPMAAVRAKEANPKLKVAVLEKANVKRSGCISMGMDGLNNAVLPGQAHMMVFGIAIQTSMRTVRITWERTKVKKLTHSKLTALHLVSGVIMNTSWPGKT